MPVRMRPDRRHKAHAKLIVKAWARGLTDEANSFLSTHDRRGLVESVSYALQRVELGIEPREPLPECEGEE